MSAFSLGCPLLRQPPPAPIRRLLARHTRPSFAPRSVRRLPAIRPLTPFPSSPQARRGEGEFWKELGVPPLIPARQERGLQVNLHPPPARRRGRCRSSQFHRLLGTMPRPGPSPRGPTPIKQMSPSPPRTRAPSPAQTSTHAAGILTISMVKFIGGIMGFMVTSFMEALIEWSMPVAASTMTVPTIPMGFSPSSSE